MDLLDRRGRAERLFGSAIIGAVAGIILVFVFSRVLDRDYSKAPVWFAIFTWSATFVLVTTGMNALFSAHAKRHPHVAIPTARVVRR